MSKGDMPGESVLHDILTTHDARTLKDQFRGGYVLIVDDMVYFRRLVRGMLREMGIQNIMEAEDGAIGLRTLRSADGKCKLILLDWEMPKMSGIEMLREVRKDEKTRNIPVMMLSGEANVSQVAEAGDLGVSGLLIKPFDGRTLENKIKKIFEQSMNRTPYTKFVSAGMVLFEQGYFLASLKLFQKARTYKDTVQVMMMLGEAHAKCGNYRLSESFLRGAIAKNAKLIRPYHSLSELYFLTGDKTKAAMILSKAEEIEPGNEMTTYLLEKHANQEEGETTRFEAAFMNVSIEGENGGKYQDQGYVEMDLE